MKKYRTCWGHIGRGGWWWGWWRRREEWEAYPWETGKSSKILKFKTLKQMHICSSWLGQHCNVSRKCTLSDIFDGSPERWDDSDGWWRPQQHHSTHRDLSPDHDHDNVVAMFTLLNTWCYVINIIVRVM